MFLLRDKLTNTLLTIENENRVIFPEKEIEIGDVIKYLKDNKLRRGVVECRSNSKAVIALKYKELKAASNSAQNPSTPLKNTTGLLASPNTASSKRKRRYYPQRPQRLNSNEFELSKRPKTGEKVKPVPKASKSGKSKPKVNEKILDLDILKELSSDSDTESVSSDESSKKKNKSSSSKNTEEPEGATSDSEEADEEEDEKSPLKSSEEPEEELEKEPEEEPDEEPEKESNEEPEEGPKKLLGQASTSPVNVDAATQKFAPKESVSNQSNEMVVDEEDGDVDVSAVMRSLSDKDQLFGKDCTEEEMERIHSNIYCKLSALKYATGSDVRCVTHIARRLLSGVFKLDSVLHGTLSGQACRSRRPEKLPEDGQEGAQEMVTLNPAAIHAIITFAEKVAALPKNKSIQKKSSAEIKNALVQKIGEVKIAYRNAKLNNSVYKYK